MLKNFHQNPKLQQNKQPKQNPATYQATNQAQQNQFNFGIPCQQQPLPNQQSYQYYFQPHSTALNSQHTVVNTGNVVNQQNPVNFQPIMQNINSNFNVNHTQYTNPPNPGNQQNPVQYMPVMANINPNPQYTNNWQYTIPMANTCHPVYPEMTNMYPNLSVNSALVNNNQYITNPANAFPLLNPVYCQPQPPMPNFNPNIFVNPQNPVSNQQVIPNINETYIASKSLDESQGVRKGFEFCGMFDKYYAHLFRHFKNKHADEPAVCSLLNLRQVDTKAFLVEWKRMKSGML